MLRRNKAFLLDVVSYVASFKELVLYFSIASYSSLEQGVKFNHHRSSSITSVLLSIPLAQMSSHYVGTVPIQCDQKNRQMSTKVTQKCFR